MAKVLGVTRAGYDAWKSQAAHRGQRALARRRSDEVVAWEHEVTGGTCGAGRLRVACCPDRSSAAAGPAVLCVVAHRLVVRPGSAAATGTVARVSGLSLISVLTKPAA